MGNLHIRLYDEAIATLDRLYILPKTLIGKLALNPTFKTSFRQALTGG
jgi:transcription initiation factor TFIIH subunit 4